MQGRSNRGACPHAGGRRPYAPFVVGVVVALALGAAPACAGAVSVYVSNFGSETMSVFASGAGGVLSPVECDPTTSCKTFGFPYAVAVDPTDRHVYVAQAPTNSVAVYAVGAGGTLAEIYQDFAVALAPVSEAEALAMIERVKGLAIVRGYRNLPRGDTEALARAVAALSRLALIPGRPVREAEANPLIVKREGVVAVDALIALKE